MPDTARRVVLVSRPVGEPKPADFRLEDFPVPTPGPGQVLLRTLWLSLDPYMRGRMSEAPSYAKPVGIGEVMEGGTVSEVVASNNPDFAAGDVVLGRSRLADPRASPTAQGCASSIPSSRRCRPRSACSACRA